MTGIKVAVAQKASTTMNKVESKMHNKPVYVALILLTALAFVAVLVFNYLSANPASSKGLFNRSQAEISKMYPVNITPDGWAFSIWGVIYLVQMAWVIYNLALLCRTTGDGQPAYANPSVLSPTFLLLFILSCVFNISWLFIWDKLFFLSGLLFLACIASSLYLACAIGSYRLAIYKNMLIDQGRKLEVRFLYVAVVNGISMYAAWSTVATSVNLNVALVYVSGLGVAQETASIISLGILASIIAVYVVVDLGWLDRTGRYNIAPYLVAVWALSAIISKNWNAEATSSIMSAVMLGCAGLATLIKITLAIARGTNEVYKYRQMKVGS